MAVKLKCQQCGGKFPWDIEIGFPKACPLCAETMPTDKGEVVVPFISLRKNKSADDVYRAMERGAEHRINMASEITGQPRSDFAALKETNMKDNLRPGDTSNIEVVNPVTQHMAQMQSRGMPVGFGAANGAEHSQAVQTGPFPNAGAKTMDALRSRHARIGNGGMAANMSERPGLETLQPGYRSRT